MIRGTSLAIVGLIALIGIGLFHLTHEVRELEEELARLNRDILAEQEAAHVLKAEWSYLNRPQRLESLSKELLPNLAPVASAQFITFARLPKRGEAGDVIDAPTVAPARFTPAAKHAMGGRLQ